MATPDVPTYHNLAASSRSRLNLVSNGGFTAYSGGLGVVEDTLALRKGGDAEVVRQDLIDKRLYQDVSASFSVPAEAGGENILGHWDIYGTDGALEVAPVDDQTDQVIPSQDGGNLMRVSFTSAGTITMDQRLEDTAPLRGQILSVTYTGRSFTQSVLVDAQVVVDGEVVSNLQQQSKTFGARRRPLFTATIPSTAKEVLIRFELSGGPGSAVGFAGIAVFLGDTGPTAAYTPSVADLTVSSGTVILWSGETCPAGYRTLPGSTERMALLTGGPANFMSAGGEATFTGGQDTHDHHPDGAADTLEAPLTSAHDTDTPIPFEKQTAVHGVEFGSQDQYPGEKPVYALGVEHTHKTRSDMTSIPPCFPVRYCVKI